MTPDERLREAVGEFIQAAQCVPFAGTGEQNAALEVAAKALVDAHNEAMFAACNRPCINASEVIGPRGFWDSFWRGWQFAHESRFYWWGIGLILGCAFGRVIR